MKKQRPYKLRRASAYFRLAAKAERNGDWRGGEHYRKIADRLVEENRRDSERIKSMHRTLGEL